MRISTVRISLSMLATTALLMSACKDQKQDPGKKVEEAAKAVEAKADKLAEAANAKTAEVEKAAKEAAEAATAAEEAAKAAAEEAAKRVEKNKKRIAEMQEEAKKEAERWTDDLKAKAKALVEKNYKDTKSALKDILKSPTRGPENPKRDIYRHPAETLEFFKVTPTQTIVEFGGGGGWYTEILAPLVARAGKLIVTSADPNAPEDSPSLPYAKRMQFFLQKSPELYGKVQVQVISGDKVELAPAESVDTVLAIREMHNWQESGKLKANLEAAFAALKPGGVLGVVQHRAKADADPAKSAESGYLPEAYVIAQAEAVGFKLDAKSEINANPKDTTDHPNGVWSLPPSLSGEEADKEKHRAIGESDRMTLRFVKPAK